MYFVNLVLWEIQLVYSRSVNPPGFVGRLPVLTLISQSPCFYNFPLGFKRRLSESNLPVVLLFCSCFSDILSCFCAIYFIFILILKLLDPEGYLA